MVDKQKKVIILGTGSVAQIIFQILSEDRRYEIIGFSVHRRYAQAATFMGVEVIAVEDLQHRLQCDQCQFINALGYSDVNRGRERIFDEISSYGFCFMNYIHPNAHVLSQDVGRGSIVMAGAVIEPYASVGDNCVIWSNAVVAHHACIQKNCWVASGSVISGESVIDCNTFIGVNATVSNRVHIGSYNIIGAHAFISKDTESESVMLARSAEKHRFDSINYAQLTRM